MTLLIGWVRTFRDGHEQLVFASDSRLSGGGIADFCPKITLLPRSDMILGFAGDTYFAYPLLWQAVKLISSHPPMINRTMDFKTTVTHITRVFNSILGSFERFRERLEEPSTNEFLVGGYSWKDKRFRISKIVYSLKKRKFWNYESKLAFGGLGDIEFAGDWGTRARLELLGRCKKKFGLDIFKEEKSRDQRFFWEPFEVLRDLLRTAGPHETIGGAPQIAFVDERLTSDMLGVYWPLSEVKTRTLSGRPLFEYETQIDHWFLDPDSFVYEHGMTGKIIMPNLDNPQA